MSYVEKNMVRFFQNQRNERLQVQIGFVKLYLARGPVGAIAFPKGGSIFDEDKGTVMRSCFDAFCFLSSSRVGLYMHRKETMDNQIFQMSQSQESRLQPGSVCDFIQKLQTMLKEDEPLIQFNDEGTEVMIKEKEKFTQTLLPKYFRHNKWRSFVRQMNMYNFKKINRGINTYIFVNPFFRKDNQLEHHLIRRKTKNNQPDSSDERDLREEALSHIKLKHDENSIYQFVGEIFDLKASLEELFTPYKKSVEEISKKRKTTDTKHIVAGMKEAFQISEEIGNKFFQASQRYTLAAEAEELRSFPSFGNSIPEKPTSYKPILISQHEGSEKQLRDSGTGRDLATNMNGLELPNPSLNSFNHIFE